MVNTVNLNAQSDLNVRADLTGEVKVKFRSEAFPLERFADSEPIKGIVVTDTVPIDPLAKPEKLTVLPVSGLLAETIMNVFADDSVSAIFGGENQLF